MLDLNDLRVFERVATLRSFSAAALELSQPRSNISRSIAKLEAQLGSRLLNRTTRGVALTSSGESLMERCRPLLEQLQDAVEEIGSSATTPHGPLRVSAGIGFGINVLAEQLPEFAKRFPAVKIQLDLTSRLADLVNEKVDVAIRLGPLPDSSLVSVRLGEMRRILCAAPAYLERRGVPTSVSDLATHDTIEMPSADERPRPWSFKQKGVTEAVAVEPQICVNEAITIHRLILNGAGIGIVSCYLCANDLASGRLVHLLPQWAAPSVDVSITFPSRRELSSTVRVFVDFIKEVNPPGLSWRDNELPA